MFRRKSFLRWRPMRLEDASWPFTSPAPDSEARPTTGPISNFINTQLDRYGWQTVVVFEPRYATGKVYEGEYYVGFVALDDGSNETFAMRCTLPLQGRIGMLVGPGKVKFFVHEREGNFGIVYLEQIERTTRDELSRDIPLI